MPSFVVKNHIKVQKTLKNHVFGFWFFSVDLSECGSNLKIILDIQFWMLYRMSLLWFEKKNCFFLKLCFTDFGSLENVRTSSLGWIGVAASPSAMHVEHLKFDILKAYMFLSIPRSMFAFPNSTLGARTTLNQLGDYRQLVHKFNLF